MPFPIITVCSNSENSIERTIKSVLEQSCQEYEYILVNGVFSDRTLEIIHRYELLFQGRMKVISELTKGTYNAMNKGIRTASGELVGIINSDDYYEKDALEKTARAYCWYDCSSFLVCQKKDIWPALRVLTAIPLLGRL